MKNTTMLKSLLTATFLFMGFGLYAQETPTPPEVEEEKPIFFEQPKSQFKEKLHYGGNVWANFWGSFYADISPMVGYEITEIGTVAGIGGTFIYQGSTIAGNKGNISVGPRIFIRQPIWRSIFAHAEYEVMNAPVSSFYSSTVSTTIDRRKWEGSPLVGLGFYQGRTRKQGGSFVSLMYNIGYSYEKGFRSPQSIGGNDIGLALRVGFFF